MKKDADKQEEYNRIFKVRNGVLFIDVHYMRHLFDREEEKSFWRHSIVPEALGTTLYG